MNDGIIEEADDMGLEDEKMSEIERKVEMFNTITSDMADLFERKNKDYGDSFGLTFDEYGMDAYLIRVTDKINRLKSISDKGNLEVTDESVEDTIKDIAVYSILTLIEMKIKRWEDSVSNFGGEEDGNE